MAARGKSINLFLLGGALLAGSNAPWPTGLVLHTEFPEQSLTDAKSAMISV